MTDLLGCDFSIADQHRLYECHDKILAHKRALFEHLTQRWTTLFNAKYEALLYDLTSTYFESEPRETQGGLRRFGYSRDKRSDCVQVVIALVGPPKGKLTALEAELLDCKWQQARPKVRVKLLASEGDTYVLAESQDRIQKERSMRRRRLPAYLSALATITQSKRPIPRDAIHQKIGAAKKDAGRDARFVKLEMDYKRSGKNQTATLRYSFDKQKVREAWRREGRYLLRTNMSDQDPAKLWQFYLQLTEVEQAFKELKNDLGLRPIHHQLDHRIEAHIMIAFLAYALQITLKTRLRQSATGLTPRSALEKFATVLMLDVHLPTTDGREIILTRQTHPEKELQLLLDQLKLTFPPQPPPRISA